MQLPKGKEAAGKGMEQGQDKKHICNTSSPLLALSFSRTAED
jgi:hypothetical protein